MVERGIIMFNSKKRAIKKASQVKQDRLNCISSRSAEIAPMFGVASVAFSILANVVEHVENKRIEKAIDEMESIDDPE